MTLSQNCSIAATKHTREEQQALVREALKDVTKQVNEIPLSNTLREALIRLWGVVNAEPFDWTSADLLASEFAHNVLSELRAAYFLMVPAERRIFYQQLRPAFGDAVAERYSKANKDIAAAGRCLALDEWTACVFHLMRVLEIGLRDLARKLKIKIVSHKGKVTHLDYAQWHDILDEMAKRIVAMGDLPNTRSKRRNLPYYSDLATDFAHFKDAWRNHVMHAREPYDEKDAFRVYQSVSRFMQRLAAGPPR